LKASGQNAIGQDANSAWMLPAVRPNHVWSYGFVSARTDDGGSLRILNVLDGHTREALGSHVARSIGAVDVTRHQERLFTRHGKPAFIRADNGREFIADTVQQWLAEQHVRPAYVAKASPQQSRYIERFNGSMRRELLNGEQFHLVLEAKVVIEEWLVLYSTLRAHRGLGGRTRAAYAKKARSQ
jgi:transposase InsO family protein